jgi:hypothetical protein
MSICLQGTCFERRPRERHVPDRPENWYYSIDGGEAPPYLMVAEEFKIKYDLITKLHSRDQHKLCGREASNRGRAKWNPEKHEQMYHMTNEPHTAPDPKVEVYYNALGFGHSKLGDARS